MPSSQLKPTIGTRVSAPPNVVFGVPDGAVLLGIFVGMQFSLIPDFSHSELDNKSISNNSSCVT